jgi:hypothetical protein
MAQVAGQNAARETIRPSWPTISIQNPSEIMNHRAASASVPHEPSMMRLPPMRSV